MKRKFALALALALLVGCVPHRTSPIAYYGPRDRWYLDEVESVMPRSISGVASWYPSRSWYTRKSKWFAGSHMYAAAGYQLRKMIAYYFPSHNYYHAKPLKVRITNLKTKRSILVWITDTCACWSGTRGDPSDDKAIDLSPKVFQALGVPLSRGIQKVVITLLP